MQLATGSRKEGVRQITPIFFYGGGKVLGLDEQLLFTREVIVSSQPQTNKPVCRVREVSFLMKKGITLQEIPLSVQGKYLKVTVSYDEGGINHFSGNNSERGYYLGCRVVEKSGLVETFELLSGLRRLIETSGRFSAKRLECLAVKGDYFREMQDMVDAVLSRAGVALKANRQSRLKPSD